MTPEEISAVRQQASVNYLQKVLEGAMQAGMSFAADAAHLQALLNESQANLAEATKKLAESGEEKKPVDKKKSKE